MTAWHHIQILAVVKMILHIDDALPARVMAATGATRRIKAIDLTLQEMDRRAKRVAICGVVRDAPECAGANLQRPF